MSERLAGAETLRWAAELMRQRETEPWTWHVAAWLELAADGADELGIPTLPGDRALAVALAYLRANGCSAATAPHGESNARCQSRGCELECDDCGQRP